MHKSHAKRRRDIKNKLMAAICMLLVSSIMMVSSTYAWFTLSTAPEVTGIQTAVGANGNLEMALVPTGGISTIAASAVNDSNKSLDTRNITWGNLVDLSYTVANENYYGLDKIQLYPAKLNVTEAGTLAEAILATPAYGADGRVSELKNDTVSSIFNTTSKTFAQEEGFGVRAVGTASGMTDRQLAYRNARSAANTAMSMAKTTASQSLNTNGASLANIAIAHAANQGNETYTSADIDNLEAIVNDLLGTADKTGVLQYIENAYRNYIIAFGASQAAVTAGLDDTEYKAFESAINGAADVYAAAELCASKGVTLPESITTPLAKLQATKKNVTDAQAGLASITATEGIKWSDFSNYLTLLADTSAMKINGYAASTFRDNMSNIINGVASKGLTVSIATGGGVYADIADHCGDFKAAIVIKEVTYNGMTLENMNANMATETTVDPAYLSVVGTAVNTAASPSSVGGQTMPISDFYGYIIDLAFRTNASGSNLLLQTDAVDRIYDQEGNEETMGHGASMTFTSTTTDFTVDQMKNLLSSIRVVFFDPASSNKILGTAKLDLTEGAYTVVGGNTITAKLYLYEATEGGTTTEYVAATYVEDSENSGTYIAATEGVTATHAKIGDEYVPATHAAKADGTGYEQVASGATHAVKTTDVAAGEQKLTGTDAVITALNQNTATAVSVLVYLDGETITNKDVAATGTSSMTGTMNLQFASSANLVPMEYTPLMNQGAEATTESSDAPSEP